MLERKGSVEKTRMLIDGRWVGAVKAGARKIVNPATEEVIAEACEAGASDVDRAVRAAKGAFEDGRWSGKTPGERAAVLWKLAGLMEENAGRLAELESRNAGKPIKLAKDGDIPFAVDNLRFFAGIARGLDGLASAEYSGGATSVLRREPVGVVGLIAPWNYPLMMSVWKAAPALAAGNTAVLKPSELTPLTTIEFGRLAQEAGLPDGVLNIVTGGETAGKAITEHPDVAMVSFTGDTATGRKIMGQAAASLKRLHFELGGKAPFVVFEDADLDAAVNGAVVAAFVNAGQDCTAATRVLVQAQVYKKFQEAFLEKVSQLRVGDPKSPKTDMGPLISRDQLERVEGFLRRAKGAKILCGGDRPAGLAKGFFHSPTVVADAAFDSEIMQSEVFGPVVCLQSFRDEADAVAKANGVAYGLASSVWTSNVQKAFRVSAKLQFGTVWINDHLPLTSETPHGGVKQSGFGKDLSACAFQEYTTLKHVMIETTGAARKPWHYTVFGDPA
ncbi:MAG: aminobutyraldehyde dehydrogenase [Elusimicrobia bacterium]|nr:aminobutyraldehyde dehydrogenase [Elusimicrobiota bacterium]